jgi:hypothetical protein
MFGNLTSANITRPNNGWFPVVNAGLMPIQKLKDQAGFYAVN